MKVDKGLVPAHLLLGRRQMRVQSMDLTEQLGPGESVVQQAGALPAVQQQGRAVKQAKDTHELMQEAMAKLANLKREDSDDDDDDDNDDDDDE